MWYFIVFEVFYPRVNGYAMLMIGSVFVKPARLAGSGDVRRCRLIYYLSELMRAQAAGYCAWAAKYSIIGSDRRRGNGIEQKEKQQHEPCMRKYF